MNFIFFTSVNSKAFNTCKNAVFFMIFCFGFQLLNAQKLVDYLDVALKNFTPQLSEASILQQNPTTQLDFGYFAEPQYTVSGAQKAYVNIEQQIPWLGKSLAYRKVQKYTALQEQYLVEQQKELLKFRVKKMYYQLYNYKHQKDGYVAFTDKLRAHIELTEKDTLITSAKAILKLFERKQQLTELTRKLQLVDGEYQNTSIQFNSLLKQEDFEEVDLPLELAMPDQEQAISFSDAYENPLFIAYENQLLAMRQAQKYSNKWLPILSLGLRYTQVVDDNNLELQLPLQDLVEPRLQLQWDLFSKRDRSISKNEIETMIEQKVLDVTSLLQLAVNDQISARISYFSVLEKKDQLLKLKERLLSNDVSLDSDELIQLEYLQMICEFEKTQSITDYYISSSKMLLYQ